MSGEGRPVRSTSLPEASTPTRRECFRYGGFDIDERTGVLHCRYGLDDLTFEERVSLGAGKDWSNPAAVEAARLVALLAGVSYYKAGAPPVIDLADVPVRAGDVEFLRSFYTDGLAEFAFRNDIILDDVKIIGGAAPPPISGQAPDNPRPLIPFGGGLDSIVTVELLKPAFPTAALFVMSRTGDRFDAIEAAAARTGLPVVRASRELDPQILRSAEHGFLNGHVPVTGILSAVAVLAAVLDHRHAVVMSNEWSASSATLTVGDRDVNHQYSKSRQFEDGFRAVLARGLGPSVDYFSELRPFSELWIAEQFAGMGGYLGVFHSCNRAFHIDPAQRQTAWCGECDKCCFIDLILSPFVAREELTGVFAGREPLEDAALTGRFRTLLETPGTVKPFECVGDVTECRAALMLAAQRADRARNPMIAALVTELGDHGRRALEQVPELRRPIGPHHIPDAFFPAAALG